MRARSIAGVLAGAAAIAGAIVFVRTKAAVDREHVDVYFADGSMVSFPEGSEEAAALFPAARRILAQARS